MQLRAADESAYLEKHGWDDYAGWHLGLTDGANDHTKARYGPQVRDQPRAAAFVEKES